MPVLLLNGKEVKSNEGESLSEIARREGVVIGLTCGGTGYHVLCEFKVLEGGEFLSPVTEEEKKWFSDSVIQEGYRLGCQTKITSGTGKVSVLTLAESVRRQFMSALSGKEKKDAAETPTGTSANLAQIGLSHLMAAPLGLLRVTNNGSINFRPTFKAAQDLIRSASKAVTDVIDEGK